MQTTPLTRRMWALAVQLYGVRSARNWGHGDFTDLLALADLAADLGASGVGLNSSRRRSPSAPRAIGESPAFQLSAHCQIGPQRPDCVAGHVGFEPANPSASYLIGIT
jgi:4-alpha-glucanotransferase